MNAAATLGRVYEAAIRGEHVDLVVLCTGASFGLGMSSLGLVVTSSPCAAASFGLNYAVVAAECGYFRAVHSTFVGTRDVDASGARETSLDCDPALFAVVVRCIYTGAIDPGTTIGAALEVLALASFLECDLCQRLVTRLIDERGWCFDVDTSLCVWELASRIDARDARRLAAGHIAGSMPRAARAPAFLAMSREDLLRLLSSSEFSARSEVLVAEALGAWCEANDERCTAHDSRVVRYAWHDPAPRAPSAVHGILVLPVESTHFHFLSAGHEWLARVVPDLTSPRGTGAAICAPRHTPRSVYAIGGTKRTCAVERHTDAGPAGSSERWSTHSYDFASGCRSQVACAALGSHVYVVGGVAGLRPCEDVDVLDVESGLKGKFLMSRARRACCVAETNGSILVAGGFDAIGSALAHAEILGNAREPNSVSAPRMLEARAAAACATIGADVYVAGGVDATHAPTRTAEYYDARNEKWVELPPMPRSRRHCAGASIGRLFYVIGGVEYGRDADTVFMFDVDTREWSTFPSPQIGECTATRYTKWPRIKNSDGIAVKAVKAASP